MNEKNKNKKSKDFVSDISMEPSKNDPFGSYTGKPLDPNEIPVQDADDL